VIAAKVVRDLSRNEFAWFVAETQPRAEAQAERNLANQGYTSFCPRFRKLRRHARRTEQVLAPLFPGYLFVQLDLGQHAWRSINGTIGIRRLVGPEGARPQPVPAHIMAALHERCDNGVARIGLLNLEPGKEMRLMSGPFADRLATITTLDDKGRVSVLLEILGQQARISVPAEHVSPA